MSPFSRVCRVSGAAVRALDYHSRGPLQANSKHSLFPFLICPCILSVITWVFTKESFRLGNDWSETQSMASYQVFKKRLQGNVYLSIPPSKYLPNTTRCSGLFVLPPSPPAEGTSKTNRAKPSNCFIPLEPRRCLHTLSTGLRWKLRLDPVSIARGASPPTTRIVKAWIPSISREPAWRDAERSSPAPASRLMPRVFVRPLGDSGARWRQMGARDGWCGCAKNNSI